MVLTKKQIKSQFDYWLDGANHDYDIYLSLKKSKKCTGALFFGHIVLEKLFKALVVSKSKEYAPKTHDLAYLSVLAKLDLSKDDLLLLKQINTFNLNTRYPDDRNNFYKICTVSFATKYYKEIEKIYKQLCLLLKSNK